MDTRESLEDFLNIVQHTTEKKAENTANLQQFCKELLVDTKKLTAELAQTKNYFFDLNQKSINQETKINAAQLKELNLINEMDKKLTEISTIHKQLMDLEVSLDKESNKIKNEVFELIGTSINLYNSHLQENIEHEVENIDDEVIKLNDVLNSTKKELFQMKNNFNNKNDSVDYGVLDPTMKEYGETIKNIDQMIHLTFQDITKLQNQKDDLQYQLNKN